MAASRLVRFAQLFVIAAATAISSSASLAQVSELDALLQKHGRFSAAEVAKAKAGAIVVKSPPSSTTHELVAVGAVRLFVPADFFVEQYQNIEQFKKAPEVLQIGRFGAPPTVQDIQTLTLEHSDVKALKDCRPTSCDMKLSVEMMKAFRQVVNWQSAARYEEATRLMRALLADYVDRYLECGNSCMLVYGDKDEPARSAEQFLEILRSSEILREVSPEFYAYLEHYPQRGSFPVTTLVYWSKEKFGLKPTISVTHVAIAKRARNMETWHFIAGKQIYASHYFEGSLGLTILVEEGKSVTEPSCWLIYFNRSRSDALGGWLAGLKRAIAARRTRSGMQNHLARLRSELEARYREQQATKPAAASSPGSP